MKEIKEEKIFEGKWYKYPIMRNALIAGFLTAMAFGLAHLGFIPSLAEVIIYILAIVIGGYHWSREGIEKLIRRKEVGIEILMLAATIGSAILKLWDEAAFLVFLYSAAEGLEEYAYAKTRASIRKLLELAPKEARVIKDGKEVIIPSTDLKVGDILTIRPGESIPTDGIILKGKSSVNESMITGESIPVDKKEGMKVFSSTINQEGALEVRATAAFEDNTLSKMIHLVEEAQEQKGKTQLFIEKFGRIYSPLVILSAFLMVVIPPLFNVPLSFWATRAVVLLVAAAPCALVMSTPVTIAVSIGRAGKSGVLIKGGIPLENLGKIKAVAFDKTGTLTKGSPVVTDIIPLNESHSQIQILELAYNVERFSEHPLAKAIIQRAREDNVNSLEAIDFCAIAGYGAKAKIKDKTTYVGKQGLFQRFSLANHDIPQVEKLKQEGKTVMLIGVEKDILGIIAIRDEIRFEAKEAIENLHRMGIKVAILTGDNYVTATAIAKELKIDDVRADLNPEDKIAAIEDLKRMYGAVAMVGDGINDAPALARATVGIAMGTAGTDTAIEAADTALMADDLTKLSYSLNLAKRARSISSQNIIFSIIVLAALIPSALIGVMSVAFAVLFHEVSELLAVANGLRMSKVKVQ